MQSGANVLHRPDPGLYFTPTYKNVGELVKYMAKNDLRFAPAVPGDEAAYLALYRALAIYDVNANLPTNSESRLAAK